jgi:hypothetical protein
VSVTAVSEHAIRLLKLSALDERRDEDGKCEAGAVSDVMRREQIERGASIRLRVRNCPPAHGETSTMDDHECLRRDGSARLRVGEHVVDAPAGAIERVRLDQAKRKQVDRAGHVGVLLRQQAAVSQCGHDVVGRIASLLACPGVLVGEPRENEALAGRVAGEVGVAREPLGHRRACLEAALLGECRALGLEHQRQLAVPSLELIDRVADGVDRPVCLARPCERTPEEADRGRDHPRLPDELGGFGQRLDRRPGRAQPQLRRRELHEQLAPGARAAAVHGARAAAKRRPPRVRRAPARPTPRGAAA